MSWIYQGKLITEEELEGYWGFVYQIVRLDTGKSYIGKKQLTFTRKKKLTKKELAEHSKPGRKPTHKRVTTVSDWESYWGSEPVLKNEVKVLGEDAFVRTILRLCKTKKQLSYFEEHEQHLQNVLEHPELFYNGNIGGRYFIKDLV